MNLENQTGWLPADSTPTPTYPHISAGEAYELKLLWDDDMAAFTLRLKEHFRNAGIPWKDNPISGIPWRGKAEEGVRISNVTQYAVTLLTYGEERVLVTTPNRKSAESLLDMIRDRVEGTSLAFSIKELPHVIIEEN